MSKIAMYLFANRGLEMSPGKLAAQVAHAAVEAYRISHHDIAEDWYLGGHYTKLVMLARDNDHIRSIEKYLAERDIKSKLIIDEGLTELLPFQPTALGVELVDREDPNVEAIFSTFELYREKIKVNMEIER